MNVGLLYLLFVSVIWASRGPGFQLAVTCGPLVFAVCMCDLGLQGTWIQLYGIYMSSVNCQSFCHDASVILYLSSGCSGSGMFSLGCSAFEEI